MVGVAGISAIGGLFGNKSAKKLQKQALALERDQLNFNKQRYQDYLNQYGAINDLVIADAEKGVEADLGRVTSEASADTATAYKNAQTALDNQNQRLGLNPNSGRAESSNRQLALSQAMATAGNVTNARNTERKNASDSTWNRRYSVYGNGLQLITGAANSVNNSTSSLASSLNQNATNQSNLSNSALGSAAQLAMQGFLNYQNANKVKTTDVPISNIDATTKGLKVNGTTVSNGVIYDNTNLNNGLNNQNSFLA